MLFNSVQYGIFIIVVFVLYWSLDQKPVKYQNSLLLVASYYFYACWDWRFLFLLTGSSLVGYLSGHGIYYSKSNRDRRLILYVSLAINIGVLCLFKYCNFFIASFGDLMSHIGINADLPTLNILLPVGISFYTFHTLSYILDIYAGRTAPTASWIDYFLFICFFPLLVAGPIERATHLLPQITEPRSFCYDKTVDGMRQILWGLFKKVAIADRCAQYVDLIFNSASDYSGSTLAMGALLYSVQIYCDFSGYTDIALGTSRALGFDLLRNFANPYFSRDIAEFWRRWHISLSSWFRDYLYIPMGGNRGSLLKRIRNVLVIFIVSGAWHGANWTFVLWGALHALYFIPLLILKFNRRHLDVAAEGRYLPTFRESVEMVVTFSFVTLAWIVFRSVSVSHAITFYSGLFSWSLFSIPQVFPTLLVLLIVVFFMVEWLGREQLYAIAHIGMRWPRFVRWAFYYCIILFILNNPDTSKEFIYFQF